MVNYRRLKFIFRRWVSNNGDHIKYKDLLDHIGFKITDNSKQIVRDLGELNRTMKRKRYNTWFIFGFLGLSFIGLSYGTIKNWIKSEAVDVATSTIEDKQLKHQLIMLLNSQEIMDLLYSKTLKILEYLKTSPELTELLIYKTDGILKYLETSPELMKLIYNKTDGILKYLETSPELMKLLYEKSDEIVKYLKTSPEVMKLLQHITEQASKDKPIQENIGSLLGWAIGTTDFLESGEKTVWAILENVFYGEEYKMKRQETRDFLGDFMRDGMKSTVGWYWVKSFFVSEIEDKNSMPQKVEVVDEEN